MNAETFLREFGHLADAPNGIEQLRGILLRLAVRGKLVTQQSGDEPASDFLSRALQTDVSQGTGQGSAKRSPLDPVQEEERPYFIPESWEWSRLGAFGSFLGGGTPSKRNSAFWKGSIPWVSPKDMKQPYIDDAIDHVSEAAVEQSSAKLIPVPSLLMVVRGMILAHSFPVAITRREVTINQDMKALCLSIPEMATFLLLVCSAEKDRMLSCVQRASHGTCRLPTEDVAQFPVPVPPLSEQHRIATKVDELMTLCDELEARQQERRTVHVGLNEAALDRLTSAEDTPAFEAAWTRVRTNFDMLYTVPETVAALRQAILQLAVQGKLLLASSSVQFLTLRELLSEDSLNGYGKKPNNEPPGTPILRISAGTSRQDAVVDETDFKFVDLSSQELAKFRLLPGDLLACRFNGNLHFVGRFSLYTGFSGAEQIYPDKLIRFRIDSNKALPEYVRYAMNATSTRNSIESMCATTAGNIGISATKLKTVPIPVPSIQEQREMVRQVDRLAALCDDLVAKLTQQQGDANRLTTAMVAAIL